MDSRKIWGLALSVVLGLAIAGGVLAALDAPAAHAAARPDQAAAIGRALAYLQTKQLPDGGIEGWTPGAADDFTTIKTALALGAANYPVGFMTSVSGATPLDYLATRAYSYTHDLSGALFPGRAGMLIAAATAGNADPRAFGLYPPGHGSAGLPINLVAELQAAYHPATGAYSTTASQGWTSGAANTTNQLWAIIGLAAAQETVPQEAIGFLVGLQEPDGGWGWGAGYGDVDTTALVVQALIAGGLPPTAAEVRSGLEFLRQNQAASGGWETWGALSADSTAAVIQAAAAAGYVPATVSWAAASGRTPHDDLLGLQLADGSFGDNALATAHAIAGLAEAPLPILGRVQRANRALTWLHERQRADGGWSFFGASDPGATCDVALAFAAAGYDPATVEQGGVSAMDYLSETAAAFVARSADAAGKLSLAVASAGGDPRAFGGVDIVHTLTSTWYNPSLGAFGQPTNTYHQAFAILGLVAAGETVPVSAAQTLVGLQQPDGGWSYDLGFIWVTPDNTGLALQALVAAGLPPTHTAILSGVAYLRATQVADGGWGDPNTSAYAMQGLLAVGEDLEADWARDGRTPYESLVAAQKCDGPFTSPWGGMVDNAFATWQAVPALLGKPYPLAAGGLAPFRAVDRGPDPDRMVAAPLRARWGGSVDVVIPFGSDLDGDGSVQLAWRVAGQTAWITGAQVYRGDGYFTATLPLTRPVSYEFQAMFSDADGVQAGAAVSGTATFPPETLAPYRIYLPGVLRSA